MGESVKISAWVVGRGNLNTGRVSYTRTGADDIIIRMNDDTARRRGGGRWLAMVGGRQEVGAAVSPSRGGEREGSVWTTLLICPSPSFYMGHPPDPPRPNFTPVTYLLPLALWARCSSSWPGTVYSSPDVKLTNNLVPDRPQKINCWSLPLTNDRVSHRNPVANGLFRERIRIWFWFTF